MAIFEPVAASSVEVALAVASVLMFSSAAIRMRLRTRSNESGSQRSPLSLAGIIVQSLAFVVVSTGRIELKGSALAPGAMLLSLFVFCTGAGAVLLFNSSASALGENWSLVARTRADHRLVTSGPFARVRHPIYLAMLLLLLAMAVGFGHLRELVSALPLFLAGTAIRMREEEKLLLARFGDAYRSYAGKTPAFIPRLRP